MQQQPERCQNQQFSACKQFHRNLGTAWCNFTSSPGQSPPVQFPIRVRLKLVERLVEKNSSFTFFCYSHWENNEKRGKFTFVRLDGQKLLSSNKTRQQKTKKIDFNDDELAFRVCVLDSFELCVFPEIHFPGFHFFCFCTNKRNLSGGALRLNVINF